MIRVNLLPIKQARRRSAARSQLIVFALLVVAELVIFAVLFATTSTELGKREDELAGKRQVVDETKKELADVTTLEQEAEKLSAQLQTLAKLESNRTGPVRVLDELQSILSAPRNEEDRFAQLQRNWNVEWDPRRLWLEEIKEKDGQFEMTGMAGNPDDVAEFLQRLSSAKHFHNIQLDVVESSSSKGTNTSVEIRLVKFRILGAISYTGEAPVAEAPAEGQGT